MEVSVSFALISFDYHTKVKRLVTTSHTHSDMNPSPMKRKEILRFIYYAIFAFGAPLLVIVIGISLEAEYTSKG